MNLILSSLVATLYYALFKFYIDCLKHYKTLSKEDRKPSEEDLIW